MAKLYLVGTPIGNLKDITLRALDTLKNVDFIACEDTRHSLNLLNHYEIKKPLIACHKFNERQSIQKIANLLSEDKDVAIITDAGMPAISDPGAILVDGIRELGYEICVIPGPSAVISAIALSGILDPVFTFIGFLPQKNKDKIALVEPYKKIKSALVFYSSPYDINKDAKSLFDILGDREVYIVKELTKIHENVTITTLSEFNILEPKGEYVLIVKAPKDSELEFKSENSIEDQVRELINEGMDKKEAIKQVAKNNKITKNEVYMKVMDLDI